MFNKFSSCFACKCCGTLPENGMDEQLINLLNESGVLEEEINCGYRCEKHNREVGGEPNSQHLLGTAADVDASEFGVEKLAKWFEELGADGVGRYPDGCFVHVDTRSGRSFDTYRW